MLESKDRFESNNTIRSNSINFAHHYVDCTLPPISPPSTRTTSTSSLFSPCLFCSNMAFLFSSKNFFLSSLLADTAADLGLGSEEVDLIVRDKGLLPALFEFPRDDRFEVPDLRLSIFGPDSGTQLFCLSLVNISNLPRTSSI
uniref:Uncharacterized protein n=1 Tax=Cacopsylla melanoneura TaxID=428564 RepID=A0A8D8Y0E7_9HEMI